MRQRMEKDLRFAMPGMILAMAGALVNMATPRPFNGLCWIAILYGLHWMCAAVVGEEITGGTMASLLSNPLSRLGIWLEKIRLLALLTLCIAVMICLNLTARGEFFTLDDAIAALLIILPALAAAPLMALIMRGTHFAIWLSLIFELLAGTIILGSMATWMELNLHFSPDTAMVCALSGFGAPLWIISALLALWLFLRLEV